MNLNSALRFHLFHLLIEVDQDCQDDDDLSACPKVGLCVRVCAHIHQIFQCVVDKADVDALSSGRDQRKTDHQNEDEVGNDVSPEETGGMVQKAGLVQVELRISAGVS